MKTKTLILAIFGLLALANAQAPGPAKAYADPEAEQPAYAYPGYHQPTAKRLAKRAAYKLPEESVDPKTNPDPPADKAYAHPGYKQPAYKRLAKSFLPKINNYYYEDVYGEPGRVAPVAKTNDDNYGPTLRLAKSFTPKINDYYYDHAAYPVQRYVPPAMDPGYEQPAKRLAKREAPKINDYYYEDVYGEPGRVAPVAKTNDDNNGPKAYIAYERLAKRDAAAYAQPNEPKIAAVSVEDLNNPEYEDAPQQEAQARSADYEADDLLGRLAKRAAPVTKTNAYYYDHAAYPDQPKTNDDDGPTPDIASERLAKRDAPTYAYPNDVPAAYPGPAPDIVERLAKKIAPKINDYYYEDVYGEPGRVAPVAKTNDDNDGPKSYIAYERLAKSFTPKINDYYYEDVYVEPSPPVAKTNNDNDEPKPYIAYERLAKRDAAAYKVIRKKSRGGRFLWNKN